MAASFQILIESDDENMSDVDMTILWGAIHARLTGSKYRVATADGVRNIGITVDIARWNGDPV